MAGNSIMSSNRSIRRVGSAILSFLILTFAVCIVGRDGPNHVTPAVARADETGSSLARVWPTFGGTLQRNMVNLYEKNMPTDWSVLEGKQKNIKWSAPLGSRSYGGPVIAGGKVYIGTN